MQTRVQRWGNSLGLRIPKSFASEIGLHPDALVELSLHDGKLVVTPLAAPTWTLDELLAGITANNLHGEVDVGTGIGNEVW